MKIPFLSRFFPTRASPKNSFWGSATSFFFGTSSSGKSVNEKTALQTTAVYACVRILAETAYSGSSGQRSDVIRPVIPVGSGQVFRSDPASRSDGIRPMHPSGCPRYLKEQFVLVYQKSAGYQICTASL